MLNGKVLCHTSILPESIPSFIIFGSLDEKSFFFIKIIHKNKKALQQTPKGLELASSPYWKALELLREIL